MRDRAPPWRRRRRAVRPRRDTLSRARSLSDASARDAPAPRAPWRHPRCTREAGCTTTPRPSTPSRSPGRSAAPAGMPQLRRRIRSCAAAGRRGQTAPAPARSRRWERRCGRATEMAAPRARCRRPTPETGDAEHAEHAETVLSVPTLRALRSTVDRESFHRNSETQRKFCPRPDGLVSRAWARSSSEHQTLPVH
jgi:hypothetical protein